MQKILIIYNSGAGSTKTIAQIYHQTLLGKYRVDILPATLSFDYKLISNYDLLIFGFPCYHCDVSNLMSEFIDNMPALSEKKKAFVFLTYGLYAGNTLRIFIKKCRKKNIYAGDYADYRAPATDGTLLLPSIKFMYTYEKKIVSNILKDIEKIKKILSADTPKYKLPPFKLYTLLNYPNAALGKKINHRIKVRKDACINCNLCVKQCPRGCWISGSSYPVFDKSKCDSCYKCIHQCPQEALILSEKTITKKKLNTRFYKEWKDKILLAIK